MITGLPSGLIFNPKKPWLILDRLESWFDNLPKARQRPALSKSALVSISGNVWIEKGAVIRAFTVIEGPVFIGKDAVIGPHAYIRPFSIIGEGVKIGHCTEIKASIIGRNSAAAHFAYIGDSIIGSGVNLGAGAKLANLRFDKKTVFVTMPDGKKIDSGRKKLGAIICDNAQLGVSAVTMPGTIIESNAMVMPGKMVRGIVRAKL